MHSYEFSNYTYANAKCYVVKANVLFTSVQNVYKSDFLPTTANFLDDNLVRGQSTALEAEINPHSPILICLKILDILGCVGKRLTK